MTLLLFGSFIFFLVIRVPVVFAFGLSILTVLIWQGDMTLMFMAQRAAAGLNSFALLAAPLFILMGAIINLGGCGEKLVDFAKSLVGQLTGGLAHANILASILDL